MGRKKGKIELNIEFGKVGRDEKATGYCGPFY